MATPRHRAARLALAVALLANAFPLPALAQDSGEADPGAAQAGPSAKDRKKAAALVEENAVFKKLLAPEQAAVLEHLSFQESMIDEEIDKASMRWLDGTTLKDIEAKRLDTPGLKRCTPVLSQEKCEEKQQPPVIRWDSKRVDVPPFSELFPDNEWAMDADQKAAFKKDIDQYLDLIKAQHGRVESVTIFSAANTLANGGKAVNMTHEQLSKNRAETAKTELKAILGDYAPDDSKFFLDWKGENGNGTSGPSSPYKCRRDKKYCPDGKGGPPSKKEMLEYLAHQDSSAPSDAEVKEGAEPEESAVPTQSTFQTGKIKELGGDKKDSKVPIPAAGGKCVAPAPTTVWDLYPLYYYQFKYVRVSLVVSYPSPVQYDQPPKRDCKARELVVCTHIKQDGTPPKHKRPPLPPGYRFKRVKHFLKCLFRKKTPCPDFECKF